MRLRLLAALAGTVALVGCSPYSNTGAPPADAVDADTVVRDAADSSDEKDVEDAVSDDTEDAEELDAQNDAGDARDAADSGPGFDGDAGTEKTIRIELTWTNPEDPDETDDEGSDLDLHLVKMGPGKWFESPYDIFFKNPNKSGSNIWKPEAPELVLDDRDGAGPEVIELPNPQPCEWYAVGVHYYEKRFGTAYATVRIEVEGSLVFEANNVALSDGGEFWDVARIHAQSYAIHRVANTNPSAPIETEPTVTSEMKNSGRCTNRNLY